jgi:hypothetical protein
MRKPARPAPVRFYVDADVLGLAKVLVQVGAEVTYPGDPGGPARGGRVRQPCPIKTTDTPDTVWIPEVARRGWIIITRDRHIHEHKAEVEAVRAHGAKMVVLAGYEARDTLQQLETLMCQWRRIQSLIDKAGPVIYAITRTTFRELPI